MKYLIVILSLLTTCNLSSEKITPTNYLLRLSNFDEYHGVVNNYWYLEYRRSTEALADYEQLEIEGNSFRITNMRILTHPGELSFCCEKGDAKYLLSPEDFPEIQALEADYRELAEQLCPKGDCDAKLKEKMGYVLSESPDKAYALFRVNIEGCRCLPYYDRKFSSLTDTLFVPLDFVSVNKLTDEEIARFSAHIDEIKAQPLIKEIGS